MSEEEATLYSQIVNETLRLVEAQPVFDASCVSKLHEMAEDRSLHRPESVMNALKQDISSEDS